MTAEEMKDKHEQRQNILNQPEVDSYIWRYFPLDKFLCLITSSQLFFAKASSFEDPFEGDYGSAAKQKIHEQYGDEQYLRDFNTSKFLKQRTYISCWHENQHESDAMWKLYGNAIAIKAKFANIQKLLIWSGSEIKYSGRINYIDYATEYVNVETSYLPYFLNEYLLLTKKKLDF